MAKETGNAWDVDGTIEKRGTYLWNDNTFFGQGTLQASVYSGDNDGFGLMYGIQSTGENYYRVSFDNERKFARLVKVNNGVFTVLAQNTNFQPPLATWMPLKVVRSGSSHKVYLNNSLVLTANDTTFSTGSIGLYAWAMSDIRFDDVSIATP